MSNIRKQRIVQLKKRLALSPVLGVLAESEQDALLRTGTCHTFDAGQDLFRVGEVGTQIQILLHGRVRLWRLTTDGHLLVLRICPIGEVLGQMSALDESPHSINATAVDEVEVLTIQAQSYRQMVEQNHAMAIRLAIVLAQRVRCLSDELEAMKFSSIGQRVVWQLQEAAQHLRVLRLTHQDLADRVGATRENVSRVLGLLCDQGIIRLGRGSIEIIEPDRLDPFVW